MYHSASYNASNFLFFHCLARPNRHYFVINTVSSASRLLGTKGRTGVAFQPDVAGGEYLSLRE